MRQQAAIILLLTLATLSGGAQIIQPVRALKFYSPASLPNPDPNDNVFPKSLQLQNGSVWMVWEKIVQPAGGQIYLMINNGYGWGQEILLVGSGYDNISPSVAQLDNGTIILAWSRGTSGNFNSYNVYTSSDTNNKWTPPAPLVSDSPSNFDPVLSKMKDGTVWLVWSRSSSLNGNGDLYYKTLRGGVWSVEVVVPTASSPSWEEKLPTLTQSADGKTWVCYETNITGTPQIFCTTFNGVLWTTSIALTNTSDTDKWPNISVDRAGSIWIFWSRELPNGTTAPPNPQTQYQWDIYYKSSSDNGTTWSNDAVSFSSVNTDEQHPAALQGPDKKLWVVFDSCCNSAGNPYGNPNLFLLKSEVIPAHDLALASITMTPSPNPRLGENATFTLTVIDPGSYIETSTLLLYINSTLVGSMQVSTNPGGTKTYSFKWISTSHNPGRYLAIGTVLPVNHEFNTQNNKFSFDFLLTFRGDVDRNGEVNIIDLSTVAIHFGSIAGSSNYSLSSDLNSDGKINIFDLATCAADAGGDIH